MADAPATGYEPKQTDSKTCIDVISEYAPLNIAARRENFDIEDDLTFAVSEDLEHVPQQAVGSRCPVASTVSALMNLDSLSTGKPVRGYESIIVSFSSTGKPVGSDESVASVERNVSGTQVERVPSSANRPGVREYLERKAEVAIQAEVEARRKLSDAEAHLESRAW